MRLLLAAVLAAGAVSDLRQALELDPARRDKIQSAIDALAASPAEEAQAAPERHTGEEESLFIK